jgi:hypothetical protein
MDSLSLKEYEIDELKEKMRENDKQRSILSYRINKLIEEITEEKQTYLKSLQWLDEIDSFNCGKNYSCFVLSFSIFQKHNPNLFEEIQNGFIKDTIFIKDRMWLRKVAESSVNLLLEIHSSVVEEFLELIEPIKDKIELKKDYYMSILADNLILQKIQEKHDG